MQLGEDCEIVPTVEMVLKLVRKTSVSGHHPWPDQARCEYPSVAMWVFARDFRAYRERRLTTKPSLLNIFQSCDYLTYFKMHLDFAVDDNVRPNKMSYPALVIGDQAPKRPHPALEVSDLVDSGAEADDESKPPRKPKKQPKAAGDKAKPPKTSPPRPKPEPKPYTGGGADTKGDTRLPSTNLRAARLFPRTCLWGVMTSRFAARDSAVEAGSVGRHRKGCLRLVLGRAEGLPTRQTRWRAGVVRSRTHGPDGPQATVHIAVCKTTDLQGPLYLNNKKFWTKALSGHPSSEAKAKVKPAAGAAKSGTPAPSDDEDDDDDGP